MTRRLAALAAAAIGFLLSACVPILNLAVPRAGYTVKSDIAYGADPRQKLDIYIPDGLVKPAPVILFFYGGSWSSGSKDMYRAFGQAFASKGIVTVVADYRLYPQVKYPAFVRDGAAALRFVHETIAEYHGDPDRIFLAGHSAGAYIAVMLDSDLNYLKEAHANSAWVRGVIGIAGPYDFLPLTDPDLIDNFGGANVPATQPITYIDGRRAPMLLAHGTGDDTVNVGNTRRMTAKLRAFGSEVTEIEYPGVGHVGIILSLAPGLRGNTTLREDVTKFVFAH